MKSAKKVRSETQLVSVFCLLARLVKSVSMVKVTALLSAREARLGTTMETASP